MLFDKTQWVSMSCDYWVNYQYLPILTMSGQGKLSALLSILP